MSSTKDDYLDVVSETGNWNVAKQYSFLKIMKPLALADEYENIAIFGSSSLLEELQNIQISIDELKIKGFSRLVNILIQLINNTIFAIKGDSDKNKLKGFLKELTKINKISSTLYSIKYNQILKTKELKIDKEKYNKILSIVQQIKSDININLNHSHLIFTDKEEFDPAEMKKKIKQRATTTG